MFRRRTKGVAGGIVVLVAVVAASLGVAGAGASEQDAFALPRAQTFYMHRPPCVSK